ncbi:MAG TPA: hypothetical protein VEH27_10565 [Methylomirabilota bacterium]|nr:hypothetical protein [Methylomirabilota bacterium]
MCLRLLFLLLLLVLPVATGAAATVESTLNYLSLRVHPAETRGPFGFEYEGRFTTDEFEVNNELGLASSSSPYDHAALYLLTDPSSFEDIVLFVEMYVPLANKDTNAVIDFYEYKHAVSTNTTGRFSTTGQNPGPVNVSWNRAASNSVGTLTLNFPTLGLTFNHLFEILEYRGTYTYVQDLQNLTGTNAMVRVGVPEHTIRGSLNLIVSNANQIAWDDGSASWMDQDRGGLTFTPINRVLQRNGATYADAIAFEDGYRPTAASDYQFAVFVLRDPRDKNNNGVPDLTDPNTNPSPLAPKLSVRLSGNSLIFRIEGAIGAIYDLESRTSLTTGSWSRQQTITMPTAIHEISLPRPTNPRQFWRLRVK